MTIGQPFPRAAITTLTTTRFLVALTLVTISLVSAATSRQGAHAATNLVANPSLETLDGTGFPQCWQQAGWGSNTYSYSLTTEAHSGSGAMALTIDEITSGDRKMLMSETAACAPAVTAGHQYDLSVWYKTTIAKTVVTVFRHDTTAGWQYWTDLATLPVAATYTRAEVRTPAIPAGTDQISWGVSLYGAGTLVTDDYSMTDVADSPSSPPPSEPSLVVNPSLETLDGTGFPQCWQQAGWGSNTYSYSLTTEAHSGSRAMALTIDEITSGDRKMIVTEADSCAPRVTAGHQYDLSVWYKTTTPNTVITVFRHDTTAGWQYWTDLATLPVAATYTRAEARTPAIPAGTDQISWGVSLYGAGTLVTDDYSMTDVAAEPVPDPTCTAGSACSKGSWTVLPFEAPVRAIHAVVLPNNKVLLIAGSGNDVSQFKAGTFLSAVYDVATGGFTKIPTPGDFFCSGHAHLPDGRILIMGGNKAYPTADGTRGYEGLNTSYIFDPATATYERVNNLNDGHWYPSATSLGNGDVLSLGGLGGDSSGTVVTEYFSASEERWLRLNEVKQTWRFWGLYPSMILMQDGRLFYTGSHVFGDGLPGTGASIYDYNRGTVTDVAGLQRKDERDQSMSVLLPPAQDQRVLTIGGGNSTTNPDANRLTDIIDLKQPTPVYTPGPLLPTGLLSGGVPQTATQGKMYVSAVLLPDGKVFETGGGLHNRADPVFEASMFDPVTNTFTPGMATDPVPRTYHSSAFLLPDGRVMAVGENPGNGSFDQRISIYSPPYLFKGPRPQITGVASEKWAYGSAQTITVDSPVVKAALIRPAAVTHSSDPNQRYVDLPMTVQGNTVGLNLTSNPNLAPPGYYMLFVTDANGVPSVARWVHVG